MYYDFPSSSPLGSPSTIFNTTTIIPNYPGSMSPIPNQFLSPVTGFHSSVNFSPFSPISTLTSYPLTTLSSSLPTTTMIQRSPHTSHPHPSSFIGTPFSFVSPEPLLSPLSFSSYPMINGSLCRY